MRSPSRKPIGNWLGNCILTRTWLLTQRRNSRLWERLTVVVSSVLSDADKRKTYDVFGDVEGVHDEFAEYFEEHFFDLLSNMFDMKMTTRKGGSKRPKPMAKTANMKRAMKDFDFMFAHMMEEERKPKVSEDDEWEDI